MKISSPLLSSPLLSSPLLSSKPYAPNAKVASDTNHARSGYLLQNGGRYIEQEGEQVLLTAKNFLPILQGVFEPVPNPGGKDILPQLVENFENNAEQHLDFEPIDTGFYFDSRTNTVEGEGLNIMNQLLFVQDTPVAGTYQRHVLLTSTASLAPEESFKKNPSDRGNALILDLIEEGKEISLRFPNIAQNLIDGNLEVLRH
jgi:hypothetical protein